MQNSEAQFQIMATNLKHSNEASIQSMEKKLNWLVMSCQSFPVIPSTKKFNNEYKF